MTSKFAIIFPTASYVGDGLADICNPFISLFHLCTYERICGYSLGHNLEFFAKLEDAERTYLNESGNAPEYSSRRQSAIIEFKVNDAGNVTSLLKIREIKGLKETFTLEDDRKTITKHTVPNWVERGITASDLTSGALDDLNRKYKAKPVENDMASDVYRRRAGSSSRSL